MLNQVSTTLLGLAVVFFGGVAALMRPVERSIEELEKKVEEKVGAVAKTVEDKVDAVEKKVDSLALVTQTTLVLTILGSAAAAFRSSGLQLPV